MILTGTTRILTSMTVGNSLCDWRTWIDLCMYGSPITNHQTNDALLTETMTISIPLVYEAGFTMSEVAPDYVVVGEGNSHNFEKVRSQGVRRKTTSNR